MKIIARNKKASHDYFLLDKYECGIVLKGTEIKSVRATKVSIVDAYARVRNGEIRIILGSTFMMGSGVNIRASVRFI